MSRRKKIATYNALKGIGALGILFSHMSYLKDGDNPFWRYFYIYFMSKGAICTTLFMICSGFFLNYAWKEKKFSVYILGKIKRVYPLTVIVFLAALVVDVLLKGNGIVNESLVGSGQWIFSIIANLFLFKAFIPVESVFYSFHGPSWYISVLIVFYVIAFPFVRGLHSDFNQKWRSVIWKIITATYCAELVICIYVHLNGYDYLYPCYINPIFRIFGEGFLGILLCEYIDELVGRIDKINYFEIAAVIGFIAAFLVRNIHLNIMYAWIQSLPMVLLLIAFRDGKGIVSRLLKTRGLQFLGDVSFELYMTHAFVYEGLPIIIGKFSDELQLWTVNHAGTRFGITLVLSIFTAGVVHLILGKMSIIIRSLSQLQS